MTLVYKSVYGIKYLFTPVYHIKTNGIFNEYDKYT